MGQGRRDPVDGEVPAEEGAVPRHVRRPRRHGGGGPPQEHQPVDQLPRVVLGAFLGIALVTGTMDFSLRPILSGELGMTAQLLLMGALLIGFGIKIPLFPFHTWLPDAHTEASTPVSVLLAGVLLKLGTYGLLRFCLSLFPEAWQVAAPWLAGWAAISVLYGSLAAIAQTDMKRMVAYSSVGHMGYVRQAAL